MSDYAISVHILAQDPLRVISAITDTFSADNFALVRIANADSVVNEKSAEPSLQDDQYGLFVSGTSGGKWVSVYVDDWKDSGFLAQCISERLATNVIEIWIAESIHWGYTIFNNGVVSDRFANEPDRMGDTKEERALYTGSEFELSKIAGDACAGIFEAARQEQLDAEDFAGSAVACVADAIGLPFEHAIIGYDDFFDEDSEEYAKDLSNWPSFQHLTFHSSRGNLQLAR